MPVTLILLPGVVFLSIFGSTRSSRRNTDSLFGWAPPSSASGDSSRTIFCMSTRILLSSLKCPLLPHEHLLGSLNLLSVCISVIVFAQVGHSNFADTASGLTSLLCLIMPSMLISLERWTCLRFLMCTLCVWGMLQNLILMPFMSYCSTEASAALIVSTGSS